MYWDASGLAGFDCRTGRRLNVTPDVIQMLNSMEHWTTAASLADEFVVEGGARRIARYLRQYESLGLVERAPATSDWPWAAWMPEAPFFHFGTRARLFPSDPREQDVRLRAKALETPQPEPTKRSAGRRLSLPAPLALGALSDCLLARRTWRNFSTDPVPLSNIATLLQLTWGVQKRGTVDRQGKVVLKTSPSGGARHPIEAYLLAVRVDGLKSGVYHYDADLHELVDLKRPVSAPVVERLVGNQDYYHDAAAIVVMTAVVERCLWKYPQGRAYRSILLDAGHLSQTFCLTATALQLAPFCTMAFVETDLEKVLRVDGVNEFAVFVTGVGSRASDHAARPGRIPPRRVQS
jgi:SagB-type dehydrogenase family enzyme